MMNDLHGYGFIINVANHASETHQYFGAGRRQRLILQYHGGTAIRNIARGTNQCANAWMSDLDPDSDGSSFKASSFFHDY